MGVAFLVYRDADGKQCIASPDGDEQERITIGRDPHADVSLGSDGEVSGIHAEVERTGSAWAIVDDGLSRNGTYLNGERVHGRRRLRDGDMLRVGKTIIAFRCPGINHTDTTMPSGTQVTVASLSETQRRVLNALCRPFKDAAGFATPATNQQIATEMYLSIDAVKTHMRVLFRKFGVEELPQNQKRARLVELAFQSGLISEREL